MSLSRDAALQLLGLETNVSPGDVEQALLERVTQLEGRIAAAPTDALKAKYRRQLEDLESARTALVAGPAPSGGLSRTQMADLPLAQAAYTRDGAAPALGLGVALQNGSLLAQRYEIAQQIGAGGMGAVFRARDRNRDKDIAIKVLLPSLLSSPKARERFLNEARLTSELSHPAIVNVFDVQQEGPHCFLTMELLQGQTLRERLRELRQQRASMPLIEALRVAEDVCQGLAYAHERTVHRDIKPENLWLGEDGKTKIMDFGIAQLVQERDTGQTGVAVGTAYYMAPEQLHGGTQVDGRADQYALAACVYEMLSGQVPTGRIDPLRKLRPEVGAALSNAVDKALSPRAADLFTGMEAFRQALQPSRANAARAHGKWLLLGGAGVAVLLLLTVAWPALVALVPDREAAARLRTDSTRLQGEARSLLKGVEAQRQELREATANAQRDADRADAQGRSAKSSEERAQAQAALLVAQESAAQAAEVDKRYRGLLDGGEGLSSIEGKLNVAEAALKGDDQPQAAAQFRAAVNALTALRTAPAQLRNQWAEARSKALAGLEGRWTPGTCDAASAWALQGSMIQIRWPGEPVYEAQALQVVGDRISAAVLAPASQKGRIYRYQRVGEQLHIEDLAEGRRASLKHCP